MALHSLAITQIFINGAEIARMFSSVEAIRALGKRSRVGGEHGRRGVQCEAREAKRGTRFAVACTSTPLLDNANLPHTNIIVKSSCMYGL